MNKDLAFTEESQMIAQQVGTILNRLGQNHITREHVLLAFFETPNPQVAEILGFLGFNVEKALSRFEFLVSRRVPVVPRKDRTNLTLSYEMKQVIDNSKIEMMRSGQDKISSYHLLVALIDSYFHGPMADATMQGILNQFGLSPKSVREAIAAAGEKKR